MQSSKTQAIKKQTDPGDILNSVVRFGSSFETPFLTAIKTHILPLDIDRFKQYFLVCFGKWVAYI